MHINNIEIKLRITNALRVRRAIEEIADGAVEVLQQKDTYFDAGGDAYLKLREEVDARGGRPRASLIAYRRDRSAGPRPSDIRLARLEGGAELAETLGHALEVLVVVEKIRRLYFRGQTRIHLDEVDRLGNFLELEVVLEPGQSERDGLNIARQLLARLDVDDAEAQTDSYRDLLLGYPANAD